MNGVLMMVTGIGIFAVAIGLVGCFLGAAESAERKLRELGRFAREARESERKSGPAYHGIDISGPTPTS